MSYVSYILSNVSLCILSYASIFFAAGLKPNLRSLLKDLKEVTDWFRLGIWLGVEYTVLTTIENNHKQDGERCMIEMLEFWLKNLDASWSEVISALEAIDHRNLAKRLREEHKILQTGTSTH